MHNIDQIIESLSLEEKASLCSGKDFWTLKEIPDKGIPSIMVTDGPHGLRKQAGNSDHIGLNSSVPATCFPTASATASSWDEDLLYRIGAALGEECRQEKVAVLLGPGANIKRSPLCGRNFEYFSEDPILSGRLAAAIIQGTQDQGIGTSLKHYAVNNQERRRMHIDARVDERALREIYLRGFEIAVTQGKPDTLMCAYNQVNGVFCSEHQELLTEILKKEWEFPGLVMTDWGAINDRVAGLAAGLDLEMPGSNGVNDKLIVEAVRSGKLNESVLDESVRRILGIVFRTSETLKEDYSYDELEHHELAREAEADSAVLLKNENLLPLDAQKIKSEKKKIAVIGSFARVPRYQGSGSSLINPWRLDNVWDSLLGELGEEHLLWAAGYDPDCEQAIDELIQEAVRIAAEADIVLVFAGLPEISESEGFDREHISMPDSHVELIHAVAHANAETAVILSNGAPVSMPWIPEVRAVLETYLGGQAWGSAVCDLLLGKINPSGKLAETFPCSMDQVSSSVNFPGGTASVAYAESIYVGYRYCDKAGIEPLFPFGYGLSYTSFTYSDLQMSRENENISVGFSITNTGKRKGKEIAQVYLRDCESSVFRPDKELKGFAKVELEPGESRKLQIDLEAKDFAFWDSGNRQWCVEAGDFEVLVGASSEDILLTEKLNYSLSTDRSPDGINSVLSSTSADMKNIVPEYFTPDTGIFRNLTESGAFSRLLGSGSHPIDLPPGDHDPTDGFSRTSTLEDISRTLTGRILYRFIMKKVRQSFSKSADPKTAAMIQAVVKETPLRNWCFMSGGRIPMRAIDGLALFLSGKRLRGILRMVRKER
ncbi:beta-glucosidase family protein [Spirochaeta dissipatitropha]